MPIANVVVAVPFARNAVRSELSSGSMAAAGATPRRYSMIASYVPGYWPTSPSSDSASRMAGNNDMSE